MSAQRQRPIDFATEGLLLAHRVGRNCGSRDEKIRAIEREFDTHPSTLQAGQPEGASATLVYDGTAHSPYRHGFVPLRENTSPIDLVGRMTTVTFATLRKPSLTAIKAGDLSVFLPLFGKSTINQVDAAQNFLNFVS